MKSIYLHSLAAGSAGRGKLECSVTRGKALTVPTVEWYPSRSTEPRRIEAPRWPSGRVRKVLQKQGAGSWYAGDIRAVADAVADLIARADAQRLADFLGHDRPGGR
jgi:hypothetical protein